ncbi:hypothetical protein D3C81_1636110 [compost metagenome]
MAHGDAVVDGDGVEFLGHAAGLLDLAGDQLAEVLQVHVAGHELGEGVGDGDDRLVEVAILHAGGTPQGAGAGHVAAGGGGAGAVFRHGWRNGRAVRRGGRLMMAEFFGCCCNHRRWSGRAAPCTCRINGNGNGNVKNWLSLGWRGGSGGGGRRKYVHVGSVAPSMALTPPQPDPPRLRQLAVGQ